MWTYNNHHLWRKILEMIPVSSQKGEWPQYCGKMKNWPQFRLYNGGANIEYECVRGNICYIEYWLYSGGGGVNVDQYILHIYIHTVCMYITCSSQQDLCLGYLRSSGYLKKNFFSAFQNLSHFKSTAYAAFFRSLIFITIHSFNICFQNGDL